ncbi:MAG TPA: DNA-processing protein DprA [Candidatus Sulfotelmatobacter sp.]|nr:DNA-processing protein DprA [Candidatus Sulfotelmatobacter sp.]
MSQSSNLKYYLALNKVPGLGPVKTKLLLTEHGSARAVCEFLKLTVEDADGELAKLAAIGARAVTIEDGDYPKSLKNIHDPPPVIFVKGTLKDSDQKGVAIVGTRKATRYGLEVAKYFAARLAELGITINSGLAIGIDTAAHEGALQGKGRTVAVLGCGLDQVYPIRNRALAKKIEENGAIISEFPIGQKPDVWTFPQRNRIISGLSLGVIAVEGYYDSGAMITAKLALDQGREVFAVPGNIQLEQSKGPHWLIKQGAKLVEDVQDVLDELRMVMPQKMTNDQLQMTNEGRDYPELNEEEKTVLACLSLEPKHIDQIAADSGLPIPQLSGVLMTLELKRAIRQLPGKMFTLA